MYTDLNKVVHDKVVLINATNLFVSTTKLKSKLCIYYEEGGFIETY